MRTATLALVLIAGADAAWAAEESYRAFFGINPRLTVWVVAELHLLFAAFVLGVPIFASIIEIVGVAQKDPADAARYDRLAYDFTKLLSAAFATTAAFGGLLAFVLFSCYPAFMSHLTHVFHPSFFIYALLFFGEGFTLYLYYYSWHRMHSARKKAAHIAMGVLLNLIGTTLMVIANSWATYMMSPPGLAEGAGAPLSSHWEGAHYVGSRIEAFFNALWMPLNVHRFIANIAFGGAISSAYAAVRFLGARTDDDRARYDWMGYVGNFIAIAALIPLPFAGYWLGREIYSFNPTMGQDMMGGTFSWTFILQAVFVGTLFIGGNYYLWSGMRRIPGGDRYDRFIPYMIAILFFCFAVWLTPHNLPLGGFEKRFGLMPAKNAAIQLMILTTFWGFLLYRRANKNEAVSIRAQGWMPRLVIWAMGGMAIAFLLMYAGSAELADRHKEYGKFLANALPLGPFVVPIGVKLTFSATLRWTLYHQVFWVAVACLLTCFDRGKLAQGILLGITAVTCALWLGQHGFTIMEKSNPLVRHVAVAQVLCVLSCLIAVTAIDIFLFRGSQSLGPIRWGRMHKRSQSSLILLCTFFVMNMGLMGFIRSGLRKQWHVVSVLKDTSAWADTPSNFEMAVVVTGITIGFLALVSFVFWTAGLIEPANGHGNRT